MENTINNVEMSVAVNTAQQQISQNRLSVYIMQEGQQFVTECQTFVTFLLLPIPTFPPPLPSQY